MRRLERRELSQLVDARGTDRGPCVSLYVPFGGVQDRSPMARLTARAKELLALHYPQTARAFLEKVEAFSSAKGIPVGGTTGMALFKSSEVEGFLPLAEPVSELAVVAGSFHVRPLLPILQAQHTFYVLLLGRTGIEVLEGSPRTLEDVASFRAPQPMEGMTPKATRDFFRSVAEGMSNLTPRSDAPIVFYGPVELQMLFRDVMQGRNQLVAGLSFGESAPVGRDKIHARSWSLARALIKREVRHALEAYDAAKVTGAGTDSLSTISHAAAHGRVKTLFLERGVHLWGRVCRGSGALKLEFDHHQAAVDDILDDLAEMTLATGGRVHVLPTRDMPTAAALCAVLHPSKSPLRRLLVKNEDVVARR